MQEEQTRSANKETCADYSPADIAVYLDGLHENETALAEHLRVCAVCRKELALQRSVSAVLISALREAEAPTLPPDFARKVTVAAESNVWRLRSRREFSVAMAIVCGTLLLAFVIGAGSVEEASVPILAGAVERIAAVGSVIGHLFLSLSLSLAVVLRSLTSNVSGEMGIWLAAALALALIAFAAHHLRKTVQSKGA